MTTPIPQWLQDIVRDALDQARPLPERVDAADRASREALWSDHKAAVEPLLTAEGDVALRVAEVLSRAPYSPQLPDYLRQLSRHPDERVREAALRDRVMWAGIFRRNAHEAEQRAEEMHARADRFDPRIHVCEVSLPVPCVTQGLADRLCAIIQAHVGEPEAAMAEAVQTDVRRFMETREG